MKYPIGIQSFDKLREGGFVYVDKTEIVFDLVSGGGYYFLSRPRRFGKSLLLSTLRAYFEGDKKLFQGLAIERLETQWAQHAVLYLDFNTIQRGNQTSLDELLEERLQGFERQYAITEKAANHALRFVNVVHAAWKATGRRVVILVDEYDKPMLNLMEEGHPIDEVREKLKAFYSVLKSEDRYIRFAMLTGVSRFSKVSVFSDLNNLSDLSMLRKYYNICGISDEELHATFDGQVAELGEANGMTREEAYAELRRMYDGYHFAGNVPGMYNPFSVLNTLRNQEFSDYWFATGTPSFLVDVLRRTKFDFAEGFSTPVSASMLADVDTLDSSPLPTLFQSGYLTLKDYDPKLRTYTLGYPNAEVREGFINFLLPKFSAITGNPAATVTRLVNCVRGGDAEGIIDVFRLLFDKHGNCMLYQEKSQERDFRNIVYMVFALLDIYAEAELCTARGRMDICVTTDDYAYVIEMKIDQTAAAALEQIRTHGYADRFLGERRRLILLGVNFSTKTNSIDDWAVG